MIFKVLLANWWGLAPKWGAIKVPKEGEKRNEEEGISTCYMPYCVDIFTDNTDSFRYKAYIRGGNNDLYAILRKRENVW